MDKDGWHIKEGQWCNGLLSGYGREIWGEGFYIGDWKDNQYNGQGTYVHVDGTTYVGAWKDGM